MLWKRRPANAALGDPQGEGGSSNAEAEPGTGFELVLGCSSWGDAARGAVGVKKRLVGHQPWQPPLLCPQLQPDGGFLGGGKMPCARPTSVDMTSLTKGKAAQPYKPSENPQQGETLECGGLSREGFYGGGGGWGGLTEDFSFPTSRSTQ